MNESAKEAKKKELKLRIQNLANKIVMRTHEIQRFGPYKVRRGLKTFYMERHGMIRNWHRGAVQSLIATRKKIYRLQAELKSL